ncbi:MAG TPA: hypothetical protein VMH39_01075 [Gemmatimonadaceae bacterium]|nr:hypothetical protein [Gemmatimonadaceae bacterium]
MRRIGWNLVRWLATGAFAAAGAGTARAQGTLSTQGLGYPPGQLSTRAYGAGGALGEMDPWSPINPAAVADFTTKALSFQLDPEFRQVTFDSSTMRTNIARYPLLFGALPLGYGVAMSIGSSTLIDRSWQTVQTQVDSLGPDTTTAVTRQGANGALNDVQLALGWSDHRWLHLGFGVHGVTGRNVVTSSREFADTLHLSNYTQQQVIEFRGSAMSAGIELVAPDLGVVAFSYRRGGDLRAFLNDTVVGRAHVPDRYGASIAYTGLPGATFALRASHDSWSALGPLTSAGVQPQDAWDLSAGAEIAGPSVWSHSLVLRAGLRDRTLPYTAADSTVRERSATLGGTTLFAAGRVTLDVAVIRSLRDASLPVSERAWTLSFALTARP